MIVPTQVMPTLIFKMLTNSGIVFGMISLVKIWNLLAPMLFRSIILSSSQPINAFKNEITVIIIIIKNAITTIDFVPAPNHTMIIGPSAIFGSEFSTTKYGSKILLAYSLHHNSTAIKKPIIVANKA